VAETLAIDGGRPVRAALLPYGRHAIDDDDVAAVVATLRGALITTGPAVPAFERAFADAVGARHAVAVSSGTAALHAVIEWFWLAPDGPVQGGRVPRVKASPAQLALLVSQDLAAAQVWWFKQREAQRPRPREAMQ